ncbi:hypothetical protein [Amycolatopsis samaneae]|uniref:Uncharacterized protein n=1 Tax=Amycolatopsis samaneae TaxID=664691 RepID=A0ABW5GI88_9PSEU
MEQQVEPVAIEAKSPPLTLEEVEQVELVRKFLTPMMTGEACGPG